MIVSNVISLNFHYLILTYNFASHRPINHYRPICSLKNVDLCDSDKKAQIKKYQDMTVEALKAEVATQEGLMEDAEKNFHDKVQELQATYEKLNEDKNAAIAKIKESGLGLMKSVIRSKEAPEAKDEL
jgi:hypothetical protein